MGTWMRLRGTLGHPWGRGHGDTSGNMGTPMGTVMWGHPGRHRDTYRDMGTWVALMGNRNVGTPVGTWVAPMGTGTWGHLWGHGDTPRDMRDIHGDTCGDMIDAHGDKNMGTLMGTLGHPWGQGDMGDTHGDTGGINGRGTWGHPWGHG